MKKIPYGRQNIDAMDIQAVVRALKSDWLTQGPAVDVFEKDLCAYTGAKYAVAVANGTAALHLSYLAAGIKKNDEVIVPAITFVATANAALYCHAKLVFADVDARTGNIDIHAVKRAITKATTMIVAMHYAGNPCDMKALKRLAQKHKLILIEDAAHALGAIDQHKKIGSCQFSDMATFSFHPLKHITTAEGGAILTNNKVYYERLLKLRTHGITKVRAQLTHKDEGSWYHEMQMLGFNYRLSDIQCALGSSQLIKLSTFVKHRRRIAALYDKAFKDFDNVDILNVTKGNQCAYHLYPVWLKEKFTINRKAIFEDLRAQGIGVQVHYIPVYRHPYYQALGFKQNQCPNAENFYLREISLPIFPGLKLNDIKHVIKIFKKILHRYM